MRLFLTLIALAVTLSCTSDIENQNMDKISSIYQPTIATAEKSGKSYIADFSGSKLLDSLNPNVSSANIAVLLYEGIDLVDRTMFEQIEVRLTTEGGAVSDYQYECGLLARISEKKEVFNIFSESLVSKRPANIDGMRNEQFMPSPVGEFAIDAISRYEASYGNLTGFTLYGIAQASDESSAVYQYQALLNFDSGKQLPYVVVVNTLPGKNNLDGFNFFE